MKAGAFRIVDFVNPSGETVHRLTGWDKEGNRIRRNFKDRSEAAAEKQRYEAEIENLPIIPAKATRLSDEQLAEAERAFAMLGGKSLVQAVDFFLRNYTDPVNRITVNEAVPLFFRDRELAGDRPGYPP
jgi:hypothetical protein